MIYYRVAYFLAYSTSFANDFSHVYILINSMLEIISFVKRNFSSIFGDTFDLYLKIIFPSQPVNIRIESRIVFFLSHLFRPCRGRKIMYMDTPINDANPISCHIKYVITIVCNGLIHIECMPINELNLFTSFDNKFIP